MGTDVSFGSAQFTRTQGGEIAGAKFSVGMDHLEDGLRLQAGNIRGEDGWGGGEGFYGKDVSATLAGVSHDPVYSGQSGFWGGTKTFDAGKSAFYDSEAGFGEIGYRADIKSLDLGYRVVDEGSDHDRGLKVQAGIGAPNVSLRAYNQDADGDGHTEYGFGFTTPYYGLGMDYTTETPVGDLLSLSLGGPGMLSMNSAMDAVGLGDYSPGTLMQNGVEAGGDLASRAWDSSMQLAEALGQRTRVAAEGIWDVSTRTADAVWNETTDKAGQAWKGASETAGSVLDWATDISEQTWDVGSEAIKDLWGGLEDWAGNRQ